MLKLNGKVLQTKDKKKRNSRKEATLGEIYRVIDFSIY